MYKAIIHFDANEDSYTEGELLNGLHNSWTDEIRADTLPKLKEQILSATYSDSLENEDINGYTDATEYWTGFMATEDNFPVTDQELEQWKKGELRLYHVSCHILVSEVKQIKALLPE